MNLRDRLTKATDLASDFDAELDGVSTPSGERELIAGALLDQAHEHCRSIIKLIEYNFTGSAYALGRVAFETAVRGIWILRCASAKELADFQREKLDRTFGGILQGIEDFYGAQGQILSHIKANYWTSLCSYTHGGFMQASRRVSAGEIKPSYAEKEITEVVRFSMFCFFLVAIEIWQLVGNTEKAFKWLEKFRREA